MKKRLDNLGEVNPTAIEAFQEMKKRYEFILEQKNDLVTAKDSLLQTIQEVEATANQKFLETFNRVRDNFQKVFKTLFTDDDQCDLVLENPENLTESGIDVVASPPGKRMQRVGKFTNMIRQFSENSQFIIVTHNKMTMSTVDVIYGVTMQEPGVSRLVSVDFRSLAAEPA